MHKIHTHTHTHTNIQTHNQKKKTSNNLSPTKLICGAETKLICNALTHAGSAQVKRSKAGLSQVNLSQVSGFESSKQVALKQRKAK